MGTLLVAVLSFVGFLVAYHTYGRWLARRIFALDDSVETPSCEPRDDVDFVPTRKSVIFGHHFTSIAGTGPIVGPALAVFWGWLPALIWVLVGSIFIGAVHDFGSLVVSLRNRGQTVGEIAGRIVSPRARILFLLILFFALTIVLAIFGLVIALIFTLYPSSVLPVWISLPMAIGIGWYARRRTGSLLVPSLIALVIVYASVYVGVYHLRIEMPSFGDAMNATVIWTLILLAYCFAASVLPVWILLQPRDFINSHQLIVALVLLVIGLGVAAATGRADLASADAIATPPADAPPILPFLFITIACGAVSGFHCLVSSGTSSKQVAHESDAQAVGYGAMLLEGALAVVVILACCAGVGMGKFDRTVTEAGAVAWVPAVDPDSGAPITGHDAWRDRYSTSWADFRLPQTVGAFVEGGANFLTSIGVPRELGIGLIAVLVACFAATTLDTATRLQRYVVQELGASFRIAPLTNKYAATFLAVALGGVLAMIPAAPGEAWGTGGKILWPLFGATNQLLAGLAFLVIVLYLWRRRKPVWFAIVPMLAMVVLPGWALLYQAFEPETGFLAKGQFLLLTFALLALALQAWMVVEGIVIFARARGVLEESLPPVPVTHPRAATSGGRT